MELHLNNLNPEDNAKFWELRKREPLFLSNDPSRNTNKVPWEGDATRGSIRGVIDYIEQNDPDIMSMSYNEASQASDEWHEELRRRAEEMEKDEAKEYKTHDVVYTLTNDWEIVKLGGGRLCA